MWRHPGLVYAFLLCSASALYAQTIRDLPAVQPANIEAFDIDNGLPITCTYSGMLDTKGRLWVNPCFGQIEHRSYNFYQFDGKQAHSVEIQSQGNRRQAVLQGQGPGGLFFGFFRGTDDFFLFDPSTRTAQTMSLEKEAVDILFISLNALNQLIIYGSTKTEHCIFARTDDRLELLATVPRSSGYSPEGEWYFISARLMRGNELWITERPYSDTATTGVWLLRYNTVSRVLGHTLIDDYFNEAVSADIFLTVYATEEKLYRLDNDGRLFVRDLSDGTTTRMDLIPTDHVTLRRTPIIAEDQKGNLLFICVQDAVPYGVLFDIANRQYDYSAVLRNAMAASRFDNGRILNVFARDFLEEVVVLTEGGIVVADISQAGSIITRFEQYPMRGIQELYENVFVVVREPLGLYKAIIEPPVSFEPVGITCEHLQGEAAILDLKKDARGHLWYPVGDQLIEVWNDGDCLAHPIHVESDRLAFLNDSTIVLNGDKALWCYNILSHELSACAGIDNVSPESPVNQIHIARDRSVWVATLHGLWHADSSAGTNTFYDHHHGFDDHRMMCIDEDSLGRIWIGTYGGGLHILDPHSGDIMKINTANGLSNNTVVGILSDNSGDRWLSTYNGITIVSAEGRVLSRLYEEDGLSTNEFNRFSYHKDSRGRLLFGSIKGINILDPEPIKARLLARDTLQIYFTSIISYDLKSQADLERKEAFDRPVAIKLPAAYRYLKLKFALSNYIRPSDQQFAYAIAARHDADVEWISIGSNSELNLYGLPAGKYEIRIRGSDYRGNRTPQYLVLQVHAAEFFYKQVWFYAGILLVIAIMGMIWLLRERAERRKLERLVAERTRRITEDKETIERQAEKLKELDVAKTKLFTNISHEFRTPLTVIEGMVDHLSDPRAPELIKRNTHSLLNLVNQILDLSKIDSGALALKMAQGDVVRFVRFVSESYQSLAKDKAIRLQVRSTIDELIMAFDEEKLRQILVNLLSNAIKYTPGGGNVFLQLDTKDNDKGQMLMVSVQDSGVGIPAHEIQNIFKRFYQLENPVNHTGEQVVGTGIGLALVAELVKLMDGEITVESREGEGSTFTVLLPVNRSADLPRTIVGSDTSDGSTISEDAPIELVVPDAGVQYTKDVPMLLIVEDNADVVHYLTTSLKETYQLHISGNGEEGIEKAIGIVPDIIISDVMMPRKDGFELCDTLKNDVRTSHIPIVLLTAKADSASRIAGLRRGADVYMAKPFNSEVLKVQLHSLLESRRRMQERYQRTIDLSPSENPDIRIEDAFIISLREYIETNLDNEHLSVQDVCKAIGMSRANLHRKITALTGNSLSTFIRMIRLTRARELLLHPGNNVSQVAFMVGFSYVESFSRAFHDAFGMSPSEWIHANPVSQHSHKSL